MSSQHVDIVVIGGGATGISIARDAAMRGFKVVLVEKGMFGSGTTSRFHGILHSGARYAVNDLETAKEVYQENQTLRKIAPAAVLDTGGYFVAFSDEEAAHGDRVLDACFRAGIPTEEMTVEEALRNEPNIADNLKRAFKVPDAFVDGGKLLGLMLRAALQQKTPPTFMKERVVTGFLAVDRHITGVKVVDLDNFHEEDIHCDFVINASGIWAGRVANLAGLTIDLVPDKGSMLIMEEKLTEVLLNRCRMEADGDLLMPSPTHTIMGTTSRVMKFDDDFENPKPEQEEIDSLINEAAVMVPLMRETAIVSSYAGIRPLLNTGAMTEEARTARGVSRSFSVIDHTQDGLDNFISVIGGKVVVCRLMAERAVDMICAKKGFNIPSHTAFVVME